MNSFSSIDSKKKCCFEAAAKTPICSALHEHSVTVWYQLLQLKENKKTNKQTVRWSGPLFFQRVGGPGLAEASPRLLPVKSRVFPTFGDEASLHPRRGGFSHDCRPGSDAAQMSDVRSVTGGSQGHMGEASSAGGPVPPQKDRKTHSRNPQANEHQYNTTMFWKALSLS